MSDVRYTSLKDASKQYSFREAVEASQAPDGSLFVPHDLPEFDQDLISNQDTMDLPGTALILLSPFVGSDLSWQQLMEVVRYTFQFDLPVHRLEGSEICIEQLFHGPTFAFKDVGARFLAACLKQWIKPGHKTTILVATSGDTGGAVANAFYDLDNVEVVILYPKGKISAFQEQQIAGLGKNISAVAVNGTFDDAQRMVKQAFADPALSQSLNLTSANSINIGRWLPQMMFYAKAWHYLKQANLEKSIVVPSGNYGNIAAGLLFQRLGFPIEKLIAAHNANDTIPRFLVAGGYDPHATISTYANAMDVSDPSNFSRFQYLSGKKTSSNSFLFGALSVSDKEIIAAIRACWYQHQYLLDPHTATAYHLLMKHGKKGMILSTAHPYKFKEVIELALGFYPEGHLLPNLNREIHREEIKADFQELKTFLEGRAGS